MNTLNQIGKVVDKTTILTEAELRAMLSTEWVVQWVNYGRYLKLDLTRG